MAKRRLHSRRRVRDNKRRKKSRKYKKSKRVGGFPIEAWKDKNDEITPSLEPNSEPESEPGKEQEKEQEENRSPESVELSVTEVVSQSASNKDIKHSIGGVLLSVVKIISFIILSIKFGVVLNTFAWVLVIAAFVLSLWRLRTAKNIIGQDSTTQAKGALKHTKISVYVSFCLGILGKLIAFVDIGDKIHKASDAAEVVVGAGVWSNDEFLLVGYLLYFVITIIIELWLGRKEVKKAEERLNTVESIAAAGAANKFKESIKRGGGLNDQMYEVIKVLRTFSELPVDKTGDGILQQEIKVAFAKVDFETIEYGDESEIDKLFTNLRLMNPMEKLLRVFHPKEIKSIRNIKGLGNIMNTEYAHQIYTQVREDKERLLKFASSFRILIGSSAKSLAKRFKKSKIDGGNTKKRRKTRKRTKRRKTNKRRKTKKRNSRKRTTRK